MVWNIPWGQLSWLFPFPTACLPPPYCQGSVRNRKRPWYCINTVWTMAKTSLLSTFFWSQNQNTAPYEPVWIKLILSQPKPLQAFCFGKDLTVWHLKTWIKHQSSPKILVFLHTSFLPLGTGLVCCNLANIAWVLKQNYGVPKCFLIFFLSFPANLEMHALPMSTSVAQHFLSSTDVDCGRI